jgi:hypothetical protein
MRIGRFALVVVAMLVTAVGLITGCDDSKTPAVCQPMLTVTTPNNAVEVDGTVVVQHARYGVLFYGTMRCFADHVVYVFAKNEDRKYYTSSGPIEPDASDFYFNYHPIPKEGDDIDGDDKETIAVYFIAASPACAQVLAKAGNLGSIPDACTQHVLQMQVRVDAY